MSILISILGLAVLILFHEAGHFFVARAVGMRPRRFYLGFPPALVKVTRNGIEYGVGAIPLPSREPADPDSGTRSILARAAWSDEAIESVREASAC